MNNIALIYMGGTFGCIGEPLSPMPAKAFIPQLKQYLTTDCHIECMVAPSIKDSSACNAVDWLQLVQQIQHLQQHAFQHFVIIHGTDTLSYASALLAHLLGTSAHVVLTGSQYPLLNEQGQALHEFSDALNNLNFALSAVKQVSAGVYLAFDQALIHARSALKQHTTALTAFAGINAEQAIASTSPYFVTPDDIEKAQRFNCISLMLQPLSMQLHLSNLTQLLQSAPDCLILQGFGTANFAVNHEIIQLLQAFQSKNCAVILTTQVPFGTVDQRYAVSAWLKDTNILVTDGFGHADLYAKALKMYLQYDNVADWHTHWHDE